MGRSGPIRAVDGNNAEREGELVAADGPTPLVLAPDGSRLFTIGGSAEDPVVVEQRLGR